MKVSVHFESWHVFSAGRSWRQAWKVCCDTDEQIVNVEKTSEFLDTYIFQFFESIWEV